MTSRSLRASAGVSARGSSRQRQLPDGRAGSFIRASLPSPSTSWAWIIATRAGDAQASRISAHHDCRSAIPARSEGGVDQRPAVGVERRVPPARGVVIVGAGVHHPVLDVVVEVVGAVADARVEAELQHHHSRQPELVAQALHRRA